MTLVLESRMPGNWPVRFGGGESKKDQQWHLVGFLSYAEIELAVLSGQCLDRRIGEEETLRQEVAAWEAERNAQQVRVNWRFTTQDARVKLKRLYPVLEKKRT